MYVFYFCRDKNKDESFVKMNGQFLLLNVFLTTNKLMLPTIKQSQCYELVLVFCKARSNQWNQSRALYTKRISKQKGLTINKGVSCDELANLRSRPPRA